MSSEGDSRDESRVRKGGGRVGLGGQLESLDEFLGCFAPGKRARILGRAGTARGSVRSASQRMGDFGTELTSGNTRANQKSR